MAEHAFSYVVCGHCGNRVPVPVYCGNRFCDICTRARRYVVRKKLQAAVKSVHFRSGDSVKFITLTVQSRTHPDEQVQILLSSFRRLRQRALWRKHVRGGCGVVELTRSDAGWHAHLHIIAVGSYMPQAELAAAWRGCSPGQVVDIRRIPIGAVIGYVTKYVTKTQLSLSDQRIASRALKGCRLVIPFGSWHGEFSKAELPLMQCKTCGHVDWQYDGHDGYVSRLFKGGIDPDIVRKLPQRQSAIGTAEQGRTGAPNTQNTPSPGRNLTLFGTYSHDDGYVDAPHRSQRKRTRKHKVTLYR